MKAGSKVGHQADRDFSEGTCQFKCSCWKEGKEGCTNCTPFWCWLLETEALNRETAGSAKGTSSSYTLPIQVSFGTFLQWKVEADGLGSREGGGPLLDWGSTLLTENGEKVSEKGGGEEIDGIADRSQEIADPLSLIASLPFSHEIPLFPPL